MHSFQQAEGLHFMKIALALNSYQIIYIIHQPFKQKKRNIEKSMFLLMPATGIEPVLYFYNRILSPARLPVPPRRHNYIQFTEHNLMGGGGFEPPKQFAADLQSVPFGHSGIHPSFRNICPNRYEL